MLSRSRIAPQFVGIALVLVAAIATGCGGGNAGHVSGKVNFKGQPVPAGKVYIMPDSSQGKTGQAGFANIKDGKYDTAAEGGQAGTPGPVVFAVEGIDPTPPANAGPDVTTTVLFPRYELKAELAPSAGIQDIEVPAEAANGPPQPKANVGITP